MSRDPDRTAAKLIAVAFIVGFFGYLLKSYLQESRPSTTASATGTRTPRPAATPNLAATPVPRESASPTAAGATPVSPETKPAAQVLTLAEAIALGNEAMPPATFYLRGDFVVTASSKRRAVLRAESADVAAHLVHAARVLVEFPEGAVPPAEGARITSAGNQLLEITAIRRDADGLVNIYTRRAPPADPTRDGPGSPPPASHRVPVPAS